MTKAPEVTNNDSGRRELLQVSHVSRNYGTGVAQVAALRDISFTV